MSFSKIKETVGRGGALASVLIYALLLVAGDVLVLQAPKASAAQLTTRSLTVSSSANGTISTDIAGNAVPPGNGGNGVKTAETVGFTFGTTGNVGSIDFLYCTTPIPGTTCTAPTGFTAANVASIQAQSGTITGFTFGSASANEIKITKTPGAVTGGTSTGIFKFGGGASDYITNPTTANQTFFIRVTTYSDAAYTTTVDTGTVASSTAQQINITAKVQETLNFSAGTTVTAPGANCTAYSDTGALTLGDTNGVLSSTTAYDAPSFFRVATNATNGTKIYYSGATLKSGANSITAIGTSATSSLVGTSQFGLGIDNTNASYSFTSLASTAPYNQANGTITNAGTAKFAYDPTTITTPAQIASTAGIIGCDTGAVRYIGNISASVPAGIYTTTVTYLAVPTY